MATKKKNELDFEVKIDRLLQREDSPVKAIASVNIAGFSVHGFKVMDSQKGMFVAMPSYGYTDGKGETQYREVFHPITKESRENLIHKIKAAYVHALAESQMQEAATGEPFQGGQTM